MLKSFFAIGMLISSFAFAAPAPHTIIKPDEIKWLKGPPALPAGAMAAGLYGDSSTAKPFGVRLKFPDGYKIPPHFHPKDERVTIISGELQMGIGDDATVAMEALPVGSFALLPAKTHHYVQAKGETIVQLNGEGPWGITYVDPKDDPRN